MHDQLLLLKGLSTPASMSDRMNDFCYLDPNRGRRRRVLQTLDERGRSKKREYVGFAQGHGYRRPFTGGVARKNTLIRTASGGSAMQLRQQERKKSEAKKGQLALQNKVHGRRNTGV